MASPGIPFVWSGAGRNPETKGPQPMIEYGFCTICEEPQVLIIATAGKVTICEDCLDE